MKKLLFILIIFLFCYVNLSYAQNLFRVEAYFEWQLFEDIIGYDVEGRFKLYKSDFSTQPDDYLEGIFKDYYDKGWIEKRGSSYVLKAPKLMIWWIDSTKTGDDIVYLSDEDDMINVGIWPIVYDLETLNTIPPDTVEYVEVTFPSKEKVNAQSVKRYIGDDPLRNSCSNGTFISKEKEKEKKDKKEKDRIKK
jgi:hypothetical protein